MIPNFSSHTESIASAIGDCRAKGLLTKWQGQQNGQGEGPTLGWHGEGGGAGRADYAMCQRSFTCGRAGI